MKEMSTQVAGDALNELFAHHAMLCIADRLLTEDEEPDEATAQAQFETLLREIAKYKINYELNRAQQLSLCWMANHLLDELRAHKNPKFTAFYHRYLTIVVRQFDAKALHATIERKIDEIFNNAEDDQRYNKIEAQLSKQIDLLIESVKQTPKGERNIYHQHIFKAPYTFILRLNDRSMFGEMTRLYNDGLITPDALATLFINQTNDEREKFFTPERIEGLLEGGIDNDKLFVDYVRCVALYKHNETDPKVPLNVAMMAVLMRQKKFSKSLTR